MRVVQVGVNNTLRAGLASPLSAAFSSFLIGTLGLAVLLLALRTPWPARAALLGMPPWVWCGGLLGAY